MNENKENEEETSSKGPSVKYDEKDERWKKFHEGTNHQIWPFQESSMEKNEEDEIRLRSSGYSLPYVRAMPRM